MKYNKERDKIEPVQMKTNDIIGHVGAMLPCSTLCFCVVCLLSKGPYSMFKVRESSAIDGGCWECVPDSYDAGEKRPLVCERTSKW